MPHTIQKKINSIYKEGKSEETFYHEMAHSVYSFSIEIDNQVYYRRTTSFSALDESFTNKIVNFIMPTNSYENIEIVMDYLLTFTEYDFNRYNEEGPGYVLYDIQKQYPNIDVFYINDCLNSMKISSVSFGENIKVEESQELLDELFYLCKEKVNADRTDIYKPFLDFANLFPDNEELFNTYFEEYNAYLETLNLDIISTEELEKMVAPYENVEGFLYSEDTLYLCKKNGEESIYDVITLDGEEKEGILHNGVRFSANFRN